MGNEFIYGYVGLCGTTSIFNSCRRVWYSSWLGKKASRLWIAKQTQKKKKKMAIDLILLSHKRLHPYHPLFQQIRHFQSLDCQFSFQHFYRQGNMCTADGLAKVGSSISKILRL